VTTPGFDSEHLNGYKTTGFNVREYDLIAEWYASERIDQTGVPEATTLASSISRGSLVLDVGCGNGIPITRALLKEGHRVISLDSSSAMLAMLKKNCPEAFAVRGTIQACPFADEVFDAAVAWGVMFHLNAEDAIRAIANVSRILKRGAQFLFTSGDADSFEAKEGQMNGVTFRYFSYGIDSYRRILGDHAFTLVDVHADSGNNTYYLARKSGPARLMVAKSSFHSGDSGEGER
jgi:ubiquinone/menaquinone biosynthesis C-methylase UbiE